MFPSAPAAPARLVVPPPLLVPLAGVAVEAGDSLRVGLVRGVVLEHLEHGSPPSPYRSELLYYTIIANICNVMPWNNGQ